MKGSWALIVAAMLASGPAFATEGVLEQSAQALEQDDKATALVLLDDHLVAHPHDCAARTWLAWIYMTSSLAELTRELLDHESCAEISGPLQLRIDLLELYIELDGDGGSPQQLAGVDFDEIFEEDLQLYRYLRARLMPYWTPPMTIRVDVLGGYTTNALFGSPTDAVTADKQTASPVFSHDVKLGLSPRVTPWLAPMVEVSSSSAVYFTNDTRDFTSFDLGVRAGLRFSRPFGELPSLLAAYAGELLFLDMPDRYDESPPVVFYEGHRLELELHIVDSVLVFAGWGRRLFREDVRSRFELDGGLGLHKRVASFLTLLAATSARKHWAQLADYDLVGASIILSAIFDVFRGMKFKTFFSLGLDHYQNSRGYFAVDLTRRDTTLKFRVEFLTMSIVGVRFKLGYEFSDRFSSAPDHAFIDHRVMAGLTMYWGLDFLSMKKSDIDHVDLPWGLEVGLWDDEQGLQDLLDTNEDIRGGPSCGCTE